jgi:FtsZ-interacting cell division protein YlmF
LVEIAKEGDIPQKDIVFLNELMETYLQSGLEDKNKVTQNTIKFIDDQLVRISDSLNYYEINRQNFREVNKIFNLSDEGKTIVVNFSNLENQKAQEELKYKYFLYAQIIQIETKL